jgi:hypothetical protein
MIEIGAPSSAELSKQLKETADKSLQRDLSKGFATPGAAHRGAGRGGCVLDTVDVHLSVLIPSRSVHLLFISGRFYQSRRRLRRPPVTGELILEGI